jgi:hypothetical protein
MKDVVVELRRGSVGALLEIYEVTVAVGEVALSAHQLHAAVRELAEDVQQLGKSPGVASPGRLQALALYASSAAEAQATTLVDLKRGLDAWSIAG